MSREETEHALLVRSGFINPERAATLLNDQALSGIDRSWLIEQLTDVGDPDEGLLGFIRLREAAVAAGRDALRQLDSLLDQERGARRLFAILGLSHPLTDQFIKNPAYVHILSDQKVGDHPFATSLAAEKAGALAAVHAGAQLVHAAGSNAQAGAQDSAQIAAPVIQPASALSPAEGIAAMRAHYWYRIAQVAAEDLISEDAAGVMPQVSAAISDIVGGALEAALAVGRAAIPQAQQVGLAIIAMGKTGGCELNYISDVDVVYVARSLDPDLEQADMLQIATKLATFVARAVSWPQGAQKPLWELDANLRPEGKDGPLVRTLASHLAYYKRWAKDWEFQALLKARPIAGDMELGEQYRAAMHPMVWSAAGRDNFVQASRAMRSRVEDMVPAKEAPRQLKLGKGGLRDVEFTVQLLQLVHGRTDSSLRVRNTLSGLQALSDGGYISRADGEKLAADYRFLRALEHRIQLQHFRRSHLVPRKMHELRRLARTLHGAGLATGEDLESRWQAVRHEVRELHLAIYYRPILPEVAKLSASDVSLDEHAAQARLAAIGYRSPVAALSHIRALTAGVSRTAAIQRQLLPVMIGWFALGPEPDHGLQEFRVLSERMGHTSWYMRLLRDSSAVAERLAYVLSTSRYVAQQLPMLPEAMSWLDDDALLEPRTLTELYRELDSLLSRRTDAKDIALAGRYLRRKELLRTALADVVKRQDVDVSTTAISQAGAMAVEAAVRAAAVQTHAQGRIDFAVIGMGRFGGNELNYASDADVLFVYEPRAGVPGEEAEQEASSMAKAMMNLLTFADQEPIFELDAALRPEGKQGVLVRSLDSYREYYSRWVQMWERQALLRARFVCGNEELGERFLTMIEPLRYPSDGLTAQQMREIRAMKARVERERMPRGVDPTRHLKLGRGTLSDVEWTVQLLQLHHAGHCELLRTPSTIAALSALAHLEIVSASDAEILKEAWDFASLLRNANVLATGKMRGSKVDVLPFETDEHAVVAAIVGYSGGQTSDLDEDYLRRARRARSVVERLFYGLE
ncbi:MAG: bifunctional [glutamine synthetase] adenylyltransferase/[glutamine synthetase]-adenylyl-L-tyrosine phosphorylase [Actinomycetaceae bacterium]|nr:bifunctional [glutamine synthetase] adenylyltransferase/[glutamine synthetase]-adenylyl-L-tyrosine phosphorylase [Arcanobacterium sp.]MDD7686325.1 bifunctional [glutamine synthetase] adenylyltransferase/[glutamine synthetase]-adenylyl-L-tyrosine phosphorylase [Actinomycetaceae bacterium]MDY5274184.1 bifunctional [glutamine synthetase] adenylyltransferase/[glutamine synthetase]-adenylyl-L-tyrosine phosphorylase [Arcanobacterium sp.]